MTGQRTKLGWSDLRSAYRNGTRVGVWGLGGLAFVDAGLFPIPPTMDLVVAGYVVAHYWSLLVLIVRALLARPYNTEAEEGRHGH